MTTNRLQTPLFPNVRRSPYFDRTEAAGATAYMVYNHMYMPMDYGRPPDSDYAALTEDVTLWDVGAERQVELAGPDALRLADRLATRDLRDLTLGRCRYTLVCDDEGIVICDPVVLRLATDRIWFSHGNVDLLLWAKGIAVGAGLDVRVGEADIAPMQVQGPRARALLAEVGVAGLDDLGYYSLIHATIGGVACVVSRTGWSGGPGYEVFPRSSAVAGDVWDAIVAAGASHGLRITAPNVPRALERGITDIAWFHNLGVNALEAAPRLVDLDADAFIGRDALLRVAAGGVRRATVGLLGPAARPARAEGTSAITAAAGAIVGATRWLAYSPALARTIAVGVVGRAHAEIGTPLTIQTPVGALSCIVTGLPFVPAPPGTRD